ncbi:hypothetical protein EX30DRAFT_66404 [Ascodesmis nigricans]|uniref:Uncharacterized protein n=1 Tax=Ascodesmis nigricans TaxID=341454 RepID=A0A4S2MU14_9PEZI|nr:hypothetical protein EX30DRAFT_66404 [Ascodesmis nigricans]
MICYRLVGLDLVGRFLLFYRVGFFTLLMGAVETMIPLYDTLRWNLLWGFMLDDTEGWDRYCNSGGCQDEWRLAVDAAVFWCFLLYACNLLICLYLQC